MSRNGKIHTKKRQFRQMPVLAFLNQRLFLQPLSRLLRRMKIIKFDIILISKNVMQTQAYTSHF